MKDDTVKLDLAAVGPATERPISIAIVAMGGQGGGVLTGWIVSLAERQGWVAQSTSVPGVAQRTGATIYYVEMMPPDPAGRLPILAQMPTPGDVDVVIASEYMEAGRSILRGIVTPDRTTLIASNHRSLAISEKMAPGESIADSGAVTSAIGIAAKREVIFDMNAVAVAQGSVISAALFGSLAASGALPFAREAYCEVIRNGGKGVEASLRTFAAAYDRTVAGDDPPNLTTVPGSAVQIPTRLTDPKADRLLQRLRNELPPEAQEMAYLGLRKVVDFQDVAYGDEYLTLLGQLHLCDSAAGGAERGWLFTGQAAKYLANAMTYDDIMRVAGLKTRLQRRTRIETELGVSDKSILQTIEFMHPRMEELVSVLPVRLAGWVIARKSLYAWLDRRTDKGRRVKTYTLHWFLALSFIASLKRIRRISLRHQQEVAHRNAWLENTKTLLAINYELGVEVLRFRRLIKGYSDTHVRGLSKFDKVMGTTLRIAGREDAAYWARLLLASAVKDPSQDGLDGTIRTIGTIL
ncbi:indolepyruvate oxidoreductase subunit beta family protein [Pseudotabrizicola alkalilacus]|uniref:Indolepyruvate oxidoreductase subunit beta family protein n=1 Tax=Pseudotabrizicola alkalilacus TaxID=2305252 RepID=A0A411YYW4_9RHOB|nr:indolepyruvate oxidoreductase subunit beta family protein [Pseudotabrizicola alkalilacus]RGP35973.1 indolepyruvate oxidoreductase subunit beta family protein [Pseudotabrizicola alkalilacus]